MITSYHAHTTWSDGETSIDEMLAHARSLGIDELGISDHFTLHPHEPAIEWSMQTDRLDEYVSALTDAAARRDGPQLRVGLEADFFPATIDELRVRLDGRPFDYVLGAIHYAYDGMPLDMTPELWASRSQSEIDEIWRRHWELVSQMARSGVFDIAAHLDLPKLFGFLPAVDMSMEISAALAAIKEADMAIELNTAGWSKPCAEQYPSLDVLIAARRLEIPLLVTSDAHEPAKLLHDFERGWKVALSAGYRELATFSRLGRGASPVPGAGSTIDAYGGGRQ